MIISPIVADCIRCFNSEGAISNNLYDNVPCPKDYQVISSNSRFLKVCVPKTPSRFIE
jgi:hypothetical protein